MKKFWKIFGITLASVVGVVVIAALVLMYIVFTPKRLTPIVNNIADSYITTPHELGDVELTFFSTFPEVGLKVNKLLVLNPMDGAQSDTVLSADAVIATLDVKKYLSDKTLDVHCLMLKQVFANLYINADGKQNFDVLNLEKDTTEEDTSAFSLPFDHLNLDKLALYLPQMTFVSDADSISIALWNAEANASADGMESINLSVLSRQADLAIAGDTLLNKARLFLKSNDTGVDLDKMQFTLPDAALALNQFRVKINGDATIDDDILLDAHLETEKWDVPALLRLIPKKYASLLDGIMVDEATIALLADIKGLYNDSLMPLVDAQLHLSDAKGSYMKVFPYQLHDINLDATAHLDLNDKTASEAVINALTASTPRSNIKAIGDIKELLEDPLINISLTPDLQLAEFKRYLASEGKETDMSGRVTGKASAHIRLSDLTDMHLAKGNITGDLQINKLDLRYDSILLNMPSASLTLCIPTPKPYNKRVAWAEIGLKPTAVQVEMIDQLKAQLQTSALTLQASDVLSSTDMIYANLSLSSDEVKALLDSMGGTIDKAKLQAYVEYNNKNSKEVPLVDATLSFDALDGFYDDIKAVLKPSTLTAKLEGTSRDKTEPKGKVSLRTEALNVVKGSDITASTGALALTANGVYQAGKENILLQWNPRLSVELKEGNAHLASLTEQIQIPHIRFDYSNHLFNIADSHILLGNSDFSLVGEVRNIGDWLEDKGILTGEMTFTSAHADINEIMALTSADSGSEETTAAVETTTTPHAEQPPHAELVSASPQTDNQDTHAYLVPKNVDLTLKTNITEALIFDQVARELGGQVYVKDGVLVLEEMGFICNAAKLQLTAIYKTPRRNHIYVGFDYHMLDIDMQELVNMIPQIDTMMPMLRSFRGAGEFHLAAETYVNDKYQLKTSTTRGACSITGKDLVILDSETFGKVSKILLFNHKTENKVDSISAQATLFKKEIDVYPFCLSIDKYMAAVGGRHNLDMSFDYHVSLLKPLYLGVDVSGTIDDLKIRPAKCKYAQDFRPIIRRDIETQNATLKRMIDEALKRNVK